MVAAARRVRGVLGRVRHGLRRIGPPIAWTPEFMGFGNHLTLLLWADQQRRRGVPASVLVTPKLRPWLDVFPALRPLTVDAPRWTVHRATPWSEAPESVALYGHVAPNGVHPHSDVENFVRERLLPSPVFGPSARVPGDALVVNVRRGDYVTDPDNWREFGINLAGWLQVAVPKAADGGGAPSEIRVISDDILWCREELVWLNDYAPVTFADPTDPPWQNFVDVASAKRLVISNSTFMYWAAYTGAARHGADHHVVAPAFFSRSRWLSGERQGWEIDPRWDVVPDIPGGWQGDG